MDKTPIITLLTDFGTSDAYVAAMKGVILSIHPTVRLVDITHEAPIHDVRAAAFLLAASYRYFPRGTIHLAVVDPGVGTPRRPLVVSTVEQQFIGPDNGLFTWILAAEELRGCRGITASHYMRETISPTFHGRDIFAPAAAWLARGVSPEALGEEVADPVRLDIPAPRLEEDHTVRAPVLHVDAFGNVIVGLTRSEMHRLCQQAGRSRMRLELGGHEVLQLRTTYEGAPPGEMFFLFGSTGYLEIASYRASAAELTGLAAGREIAIELLS